MTSKRSGVPFYEVMENYALKGGLEYEKMVLDFDCMQTYVETEVNGIPLILTPGHHYNKEKPFPKKERNAGKS